MQYRRKVPKARKDAKGKAKETKIHKVKKPPTKVKLRPKQIEDILDEF